MSQVLGVQGKFSSLSAKQIKDLKEVDRKHAVTRWDKFLDLVFGSNRQHVKEEMWKLLHPEGLSNEEKYQTFSFLKGQAKAEYKQHFTSWFNAQTQRIELVLALPERAKKALKFEEITTGIELSGYPQKLAWFMERQNSDCTDEEKAEFPHLVANLCCSGFELLMNPPATGAVQAQSFCKLMTMVTPDATRAFKVSHTEDGGSVVSLEVEGIGVKCSIKPVTSDNHKCSKMIKKMREGLDEQAREQVETKSNAPKFTYHDILRRDCYACEYCVASEGQLTKYTNGDGISEEQKYQFLLGLAGGNQYLEEVLSFFAGQTVSAHLSPWDETLYAYDPNSKHINDNQQKFFISRQKDGNLLLRVYFEKHSDTDAEVLRYKPSEPEFQKMFSFDATFLIKNGSVICLGPIIHKEPLPGAGVAVAARRYG